MGGVQSRDRQKTRGEYLPMLVSRQLPPLQFHSSCLMLPTQNCRGGLWTIKIIKVTILLHFSWNPRVSTYQTNTKDQTKNLTTCVVPQTTTKECNICNKKESLSPKVLCTHNLHNSMVVMVFVKQMLVKTRIKVNLRMKSEMTLNIKM